MGEFEDANKLVMVGRYLDPSEAQMAKGMLESAGVECFLQGENANAMVPLAFKVRLEVRKADEAEAEELLAYAAFEESEGKSREGESHE